MSDSETNCLDVASSTKRAAELLSDAVILLHADAEDRAIERIRSAGALLGLRIDTTAQWTNTQMRQFQDSNTMKRFVGDSLYDAQMAQNLGTATATTSASSLMQGAAVNFDPDKIFGTIK